VKSRDRVGQVVLDDREVLAVYLVLPLEKRKMRRQRSGVLARSGLGAATARPGHGERHTGKRDPYLREFQFHLD
jgi:hypothetical protein